jgi:signal transduction histidine kinase
MTERPWIRWSLYFCVWTLLGLFFATQNYIGYAYVSGRQTSWVQALTLALTEWYIWAALTPLILWLARGLAIERDRWWRALSVHFVAGVVFALLHLGIYSWVASLIGWSSTSRLDPLELFRAFFLFKFHPNLLTYWAVVGISHALDYYRRYRERQVRAVQLEAQLAQAQLQALKMQIHPHFLFNTLHAIQALIQEDPETADEMIARLSDLLRMTLENPGSPEVTLQQELEFLQRYLEIEEIRFQDRLSVRFDIAPETLGDRVPNMILQPLVENAIRHGIASRSVPGQVEIRAQRQNGLLCLKVCDNGPGLGENTVVKEGVGLTNTRARLSQLYGTACRLELESAASGGMMVTLLIPSRQKEHEHSYSDRR